MPNVCHEIYSTYSLHPYLPVSPAVGIGAMMLGLLYILNAALMVYWIYQERLSALSGMDGAALYVIFPVYFPFMWISMVSDLIVGLISIFSLRTMGAVYNWEMAIALGVTSGLQHFVFEGLAFIMMQYGCGYQAARNASSYALAWALVTFAVQFIIARQGLTPSSYLMNFVWNLCMFVFYLMLWLAPEKVIFRRPSIKFYAKFWTFFRGLCMLNIILCYLNDNGFVNSIAYCSFDAADKYSLVLFKPFVIYYTLLADSIWWQGLGQTQKVSVSSEGSSHSASDINDAMSNQPMAISTSILPNKVTSPIFSRGRKTSNTPTKKSDYQPLRNPLLGMEVGFTEAQALANEVDKLNIKGHVQLLNFAYIKLQKNKKNNQSVLGSGSFSKVYSGEYKGNAVAVKMIFTPDLNPEVIRRCCNEAQILSNIKHENVVKIYGVSVLPPSVCIVLEKCDFGSLADVLRGSDPGLNLSGAGVKKIPLSLSRSDRMFLALGCARGVEALHLSSCGFCHRDIKSFNFLVNSQLVVKLADLELSVDGDCADGSGEETSRVSVGKGFGAGTSMMMSSWQAPEVVSGGVYEQASDIYSLAIVLWEIIVAGVLHNGHGHSGNGSLSAFSVPGGLSMSLAAAMGGQSVSSSRYSSAVALVSAALSTPSQNNAWIYLPFGDCPTQREVRAKILEGVRPPLPPITQNIYDPRYLSLIQRAWLPFPDSRPSASEVVDVLATCWVSSLRRHITQSQHQVDMNAVYLDFKEQQVARKSFREQMIYPSARNGRSVFSSFSRSIPRDIVGCGRDLKRHTAPSSHLLAALSPMQQEEGWLRLEEDYEVTIGGNSCGVGYVVISSIEPFVILWATKSWCKMTGYLLNEIIACHISVIEGPLSNRSGLQKLLMETAIDRPQHAVFTHYRKDDTNFLASIHSSPIYVAKRSVDSQTSQHSVTSLPSKVNSAELDESDRPNSNETATTESSKSDSADTTNPMTSSPPVKATPKTCTIGTPKLANLSWSANPEKKDVAFILLQYSLIKDNKS